MGHMAEQNRARAFRIRQMTVYERILRAARRQTGIRLTAKDVRRLAADEAIRSRGEQDRLGFDGESV